MKFLCVSCDEPMKMIESPAPDRGSLSIVYGCPKCDHRMAMLTNPYETQVVTSMGVKMGPEETAAGGEEVAPGCPFSEMVQEMTENADVAGSFPWTPAAEERLERIPSFVRPMARTGIEKYAKDHGFGEVNEEVVDQAKDFFGM